MTDLMDIAAVARATGLTSRALRFYEGRGLVRPLRTASGRRHFGAMDLARLHRIVTLKRAGFTLGQIETLLNDRPIDLAPLLRAQIVALDEQAHDLAEARAHLTTALSRIDRGEPLDAATLCSLIRMGDDMMNPQNMKTVADLYRSAQAEADFADAKEALPTDFDQTAYAAQWADLTGRIAAALPLDPASVQAGAFYDEWQALLAPFTALATPAMTEGVTRLYDNIGEWQADQTPPFSADVWMFIKAVGEARKAN
ncbi:MerR family transcriptional regulator [Sphingobium sp. CR2-8]|uniref:MerR family transcriptional regulator n=1 Tax=Sphingobium sp. CR2-8 TaxID=1306534 RepID=UPI002DBDFC97|nr:MerR family transcriptional regulator [Sphingobium sp. CR2-8]MEC3912303.1 MerR family transcriptional regulator [Sphingobium sp. CR2-8]